MYQMKPIMLDDFVNSLNGLGVITKQETTFDCSDNFAQSKSVILFYLLFQKHIFWVLG